MTAAAQVWSVVIQRGHGGRCDNSIYFFNPACISQKHLWVTCAAAVSNLLSSHHQPKYVHHWAPGCGPLGTKAVLAGFPWAAAGTNGNSYQYAPAAWRSTTNSIDSVMTWPS